MNKNNQQLTQKQKIQFARSIISSRSYPGPTLSMVRGVLSPSLYVEFMKWVQSNPMLSASVFRVAFPRSILQLETVSVLSNSTPEREYRWAGAFLATHAEELQKYVTLSSEFSDAFLSNNYDVCEKSLNLIEAEFGQSLWLIKNRIAFLQAAKGLEAQKSYTNQIRQEAQAGGLVAFIAVCTSWRNEATTSVARFAVEVSKILSGFNLDESLSTYIQHHVYPEYTLTPEATVNILRYENVVSIIDYYEALISMSRISVGAGHDSVFPAIRSSLSRLERRVGDDRIGTIMFKLTGQIQSRHPADIDVSKAFDSFLRGSYNEASQSIRRALVNQPSQFDLIEVAARIRALQVKDDAPNEPSLVYQIISKVCSVIAKDAAMSDAVAQLMKVALNFHSFAWANALLEVIWRELSDDPVDYSYAHISSTTSATPFINPLRVVTLMSLELRQAYAEIAQECYGTCLAVSYGIAATNQGINVELLDGLVWEEHALLEIEALLRSNDLPQALQIAENLNRSAHGYYRHKSIRFICFCLLNLNQINDCIRFMTDEFVQSRKSSTVMPIKKVAQAIASAYRDELKADVSLPIFYDMYSRYVNDDQDHVRDYSYEDFLFENGIQRPSEIREILSRFDRSKIVYFLRYVCVETTMQISTVFAGSRELAEERLAVCRLLVEIDAQDADSYHTEIKHILRRLMVQRRMKEVEQSKIYVDTDSIKKTVDKDMRESYSRYISFLRNRVQAFVVAAIEKTRETNTDGTVWLTLPRDETDKIFEAMVLELREQFVSSTEHGLDKYLSVRIRHGTLSNQLRSPLEAGRLITQRDSATDIYKPNMYWIDKLQVDDKDVAVNLTSRLGTFSKEFDAFVQEVRTKWIQIKTEASGKGLFDFTLIRADVDNIARLVTEETSFEEFLDCVFLFFRQRLEHNLEIIRHTINTQGKLRVNELLSGLQTDINHVHDTTDVRSINNAISAARTELQNALDRISSWFRLSKSTFNEAFLIEDVINISAESVRTFSPLFSTEFSAISNEEVTFGGNTLANFVDILFIVFENIVKHSEVLDRPKAYVRVTHDAKSIHFKIENDIGSNVATVAANLKLTAIKAAMHEGQLLKSVISEGGTGFHKIWKILAHDFSATPQLDFGFNNRRFFVAFALPIKERRS